jgi:hypothetical protein
LTYGVSDVVIEYRSKYGDKVFEFNIDITDYESAMSNINQTIGETSQVHRFGIARDLAYALLSYAHHINIFQLKNANVISILPQSLSDKIIELLNNHGVKQLNTKDREEEALIESLLECERRPILLMSDGLLNPEMPEHFFAQHKIIDAYKIAGYDIKCVWSVDLLHRKEESIHNIIDDILNG